MVLSLFRADGVTYSEMAAPPTLCVKSDKLRIEVSNSAFSSAKVITRIEFVREKDEILIRGWQKVAPLHKYDGVFEKKLVDLSLTDEKIQKVRFYWEDPDKTKTELRLQE